jgi:hypothetical protein
MPKFLLSIYGDESRFATMSEEDTATLTKEYFAYGDEAAQAGVFIAGEALLPTPTAKSVRVRQGKTLTTDGPFAETKEQLGGFYLVECKDIDEAIRWAAKIPDARTGTIEVRQVQEFPAE